MISFKGLKLQQIADLYDRSSPEVQKWMIQNLHLWREENREDGSDIAI